MFTVNTNEGEVLEFICKYKNRNKYEDITLILYTSDNLLFWLTNGGKRENQCNLNNSIRISSLTDRNLCILYYYNHSIRQVARYDFLFMNNSLMNGFMQYVIASQKIDISELGNRKISIWIPPERIFYSMLKEYVIPILTAARIKFRINKDNLKIMEEEGMTEVIYVGPREQYQAFFSQFIKFGYNLAIGYMSPDIDDLPFKTLKLLRRQSFLSPYFIITQINNQSKSDILLPHSPKVEYSPTPLTLLCGDNREEGKKSSHRRCISFNCISSPKKGLPMGSPSTQLKSFVLIYKAATPHTTMWKEPSLNSTKLRNIFPCELYHQDDEINNSYKLCGSFSNSRVNYSNELEEECGRITENRIITPHKQGYAIDRRKGESRVNKYKVISGSLILQSGSTRKSTKEMSMTEKGNWESKCERKENKKHIGIGAEVEGSELTLFDARDCFQPSLLNIPPDHSIRDSNTRVLEDISLSFHPTPIQFNNHRTPHKNYTPCNSSLIYRSPLYEYECKSPNENISKLSFSPTAQESQFNNSRLVKLGNLEDISLENIFSTHDIQTLLPNKLEEKRSFRREVRRDNNSLCVDNKRMEREIRGKYPGVTFVLSSRGGCLEIYARCYQTLQKNNPALFSQTFNERIIMQQPNEFISATAYQIYANGISNIFFESQILGRSLNMAIAPQQYEQLLL